jgi:hypothetical protein
MIALLFASLSSAGLCPFLSRAVQKLIVGIVAGFREDAPFRLARSHRKTRPTLGLLARIFVRQRNVMAYTVRRASRWPVRPLVAGNAAMPHLADRSIASRAVWHSPLRPDYADCHRACARLTTAGLQVLDGWHSSRHGAHRGERAQRDGHVYAGLVGRHGIVENCPTPTVRVPPLITDGSTHFA